MEFSINLNKSHWLEYQKFTQSLLKSDAKYSSKGLTLYFSIGLFLAMFSAIFYFQENNMIHWPTAIYEFIFIVVFFLIMYFKQIQIKESLIPSDAGPFIGDHTFIFNEHGIKVSGKGYHQFHNWSLVKDVEQNDSIICVFLDKMYAYVIPKDQLPNPNEFNEIININWHNKSIHRTR